MVGEPPGTEPATRSIRSKSGRIHLLTAALFVLLLAALAVAGSAAIPADSPALESIEGSGQDDDLIGQANDSGAIVATSADDTSPADTDISVALALSPPGESFESDATADIWVGAYTPGDPQDDEDRPEPVEGEELTVTIEDPDGDESTFTETTDSDGSGYVGFDLSGNPDGQYTVTVEDESGEVSATEFFDVGPVPTILNDRSYASLVDEEVTVSVLVREGEQAVSDETVDIEITESFETVFEETVATDADGFAEVTVAPDEVGRYSIDAAILDGGASDSVSVDVTEHVVVSDFDFRSGVVNETTVYGGYYETSEGESADKELVVRIGDFGFGDDEIFVEEQVRTDENGLFLLPYQLPADAAEEFSLDVEIETTDGEAVAVDGRDSISVDEIDDTDPDPDPDPVSFSARIDDSTVSPDEPFDLEIEATDDGDPIVGEDVDVFLKWDSQGPPLLATTTTIESDGTATVTVDPPANSLDGIPLTGDAYLEYEDEVYSSRISSSMERYDVWLSTERATPGEETTVELVATEVATDEAAEGIGLQFGLRSPTGLNDISSSGSLVTGPDGEDELAVPTPDSLGPADDFEYLDRYNSFTRSRGVRLDPGTLTFDTEETQSGNPIVEPGEAVDIEIDADDAETATGFIFDSVRNPSASVGTTVSAADGGTWVVPEYVEPGALVRMELWAIDENGQFYQDRIFVEVVEPSDDETGTIEGTVTDDATGDAIFNAEVLATDENGELVGLDTTDEDGSYELTLAPGTYDLDINATGYEGAERTGVTVTEDETTTEDVTLFPIEDPPEPGVVEGVVEDEETGDAIADAELILFDKDWNEVNSTTTDEDGEFELAAAEGSYTLRGSADDYDLVFADVDIELDETTTEILELEPLLPATLTYLDGTEPVMDEISVAASETDTGVGARLTNETAPQIPPAQDVLGDISGPGADNTTVLELEVTIEDEDLASFLSGNANVQTWSVDDNGDGTNNLTVEFTPVEQQLIFDCEAYDDCMPGFDEWPTGDDDVATAERGATATIVTGPAPVDDLEGAYAGTDAQLFDTPVYDADEPAIEQNLAGPALTVDGDANEGLYRALLTDSLLEEWSVDSPEAQLNVSFEGEQLEIDTEPATDGTVVDVNLTYSAGTLAISPAVGAFFEAEIDEDSSELTVEEGEDATVVVDVENTGLESGTGELTASTGTGEDSIELDLDQDETTTETLTVPAEGGDDEVTITTRDNEDNVYDTDTADLTVEVPPYFRVDVDEAASQLFVEEDEPFEVVATIENNGTETDTQEIQLTDFDGEEANSTEITVDGGETETVELWWDTEGIEAGSGTVTVVSNNETDAVTAQILDSEGLEWRFQTGDRVDSSPTIIDRSTVLVGSSDDRLYTLDLDDGTEIANVTTDGAVRSSPQVVNETIYVGSFDSHVYAFDGTTGEQEWAFETGDEVLSSPTVQGEIVYVGSRDGTVYALNRSNGEEMWSFDAEDEINGSPTVVGDTVYIGDREQTSFLNDGNLYALDAKTGEEQWTHETDNWIFSSATVDSETVYIGSDDQTLYALDASSGDVDWTFTEPGDFVTATPTVVEDTVYVGAHDDTFYAVNATTGEKDWEFTEADDYFHSSPTIIDGTVYVGSIDGTVYGLDAENGEEVWSYETGAGVWSSPTVVDGTLVVGSQDGGVYGLDVTDIAGPENTSSSSRFALGTLGHTDQWSNVAAEPTLSGTVVDETTGDPIEATVTAKKDGSTAQSVTTDADGSYELWLDTGTYDVVVDAAAFEQETRTVTVDPESPDELDVELERIADGFTLEAVDSSDAVIVEGEEATVTVDVTNNDPETLERSVSFETDDREETTARETTQLELDPGENRTITLGWQTAEGDAGEYESVVSTGNDTVSKPLAVIGEGEPYYDVSEVEANVTAVGEELVVSPTVTNLGDGPGEQDVSLFITDEAIESSETESQPQFAASTQPLGDDGLTEVDVVENISLAPEESDTLELRWEATWPNRGLQNFSVATDDTEATTQAAVVEDGEPTFDLELDRIDAAVRPGDTVSAQLTVENLGAENDTQETELLDETGAVLDSTELSLSGAESETVELSWETTDQDEGATELELQSEDDTLTATVAVLTGEVNYQSVTVSDTEPLLGSQLTVTATVENTDDDLPTEYLSPAVTDTGVVDEQAGEIPAGEDETVTMTVPIDRVGTTNVSVGDASPVEVTVERAWSQAGLGDANSGHSPDLTSPTTAVDREWNESIGATPTDPAIVDGVLYAGDDSGTVWALDAATGATLWEESVGASVTAPVAVDEYVIVGTEDSVVALDRDGDTTQWEEPISGDTEGVTVANGVVYATGGDEITAIDAADGELLWTFQISDDAVGVPAVVGERLYVSTDSGVDALATGADVADAERKQWATATAEPVNGSAAFADGSVYVGTAGDDAAVYAINATSGALQWDREADADVIGSPALADNEAVVGLANGQVYGFDASDGSIAWGHQTTGTSISHSPAVADGIATVSVEDTVDGKSPRVVGVDTASGTNEFSHDIEATPSTGPAVLEEAVYVGHEGGELLSITEQDEGAIFDVEYLSVNQTEATEGDNVGVNATVRNIGDAPGEWEVDVNCQLEGVLFDCGVFVEQLEPNEVITTSTPTTLGQAGEWFIIVDSDPVQRNIQVSPPGNIEGFVSDSVTQDPLEDVNATVSRQILGGPGITEDEQFTDEDGFYRTEPIPPRTYFVEFERDGYVDEEFAGVPVQPAQTTVLNVSMEEKVWLQGELKQRDGTPAANHTVSADEMIPEDIDVTARNLTTEDGSFELGVPTNESYALVATEQNVPARDIRYFPENDVADLYAAQSIDLDGVTPGSEIDIGTIQFPEGYNVDVTVIDAAGDPVVGANVTWRDINPREETFGDFKWIGTDFDGRPGGSFDDPGVELPAGPAEVVVETPWGDRVLKELDLGEDRDLVVEPDPELANQSKFEVTEIAAQDPGIVGEPVKANATIENVGTVSGTQNVTLGTDAAEEPTEEELSLLSGENATITFEWVPELEDIGTHPVTASTANDSETIGIDVISLDEPYFDVQFRTAGFVEEGDPVDITARVENLAEVGDTQDVIFRVEGEEVDIASDITLGGGDSTTATFEWETEVGDAGIVNVSVASEDRLRNDTMEVLGPPEPTFRVSIDDADEVVEPGETATVDASVVNVGRESGTQTIEMTDEAGEVLDETELSLGAGEVREPTDVTFTWDTTVADFGEHELMVASEDDNATTIVDVTTEVTVIEECTVINESGVYVLGNDIETDPAGGVCIEITADDVFLDGDGYSVLGEQETVGIGIDGADSVTVEDVESNFHTEDGAGILAENSTNLTLSDVRTESNTFGLRTANVSDFTIEDSAALFNNRAGVQITDSEDGLLMDVDGFENDQTGETAYAGILVGGDDTDNVHMEEVTAMFNTADADGIRIADEPTGITISNSTTESNDGDGIAIRGGEVTLENTTVDEASQFGDEPDWGLTVEEEATASVENLDIGDSTAPETTLSFTGDGVRLAAEPEPPESPDVAAAIGRYVELDILDDGSFDGELAYEEEDLGEIEEDSLLLWSHDGEWSEVTNSLVRPERNVIEADIDESGLYGAFGPESAEFEEVEDWYDLDAVRNEPTGAYVLGTDLNESSAGYQEIASPDANDGFGFEPIGEFRGIFDGDGHQISDLVINRSADEVDNTDIGLFKRIGEGGQVRNVSLVDVDISGSEFVGGVAGQNWNSITDVSVTGEIEADEGPVGAVAGQQYDFEELSRPAIEETQVGATVEGTFDVGGVVGDNRGGLISETNVSGSVQGEISAGGISGWNTGTILRSASNATIESGGSGGGIVHLNWGVITDTYFQGSVDAGGDAGGIAGINERAGSIKRSYATGDVTGEAFVGALIGENADTELVEQFGTVEDAYWDGDELDADDAVGNGTEGVERTEELTTAAMTGEAAAENMTALNFDYVWSVVTEPADYPRLAFEIEPGKLPELDINDNGQSATDTTGDGLLNDVRGDGAFTVADVQTLFANRDSEVVQENAELFDFAGVDEDELTIFDIQGLFDRLVEGGEQQ